jgi:precorrin-6B methylase 2
MVWIVPDELEQVVHAATRAALGDAPLATAALTRAILDRSRRYTSERDRPPGDRASDRTGDLAARAMFFTVTDAMKIAVPLGELTHRGALPGARPLRIVDLGAGCGAMSLGAIVALPPGVAVEITAIDRDARALAIARAAVRALAARRGVAAAFAVRDDDLVRAALPAADLVVLGSVLNELPGDARLPAVLRALAAVGEDGAVIVIEPALRDTARALHEVRDAVLAGGHGHVFAPCTRAIAPCPALADPDDWCHEDRALQLPPRTAELARLTHLRDGGMKFAYLVLRRRPLALVEAAPAWRVVSAPMPAKGKLEIIGCSAAGRVPLRLLRRHRTAGNRSIEAASRGDVVVIERSETGGGACDAIDRVEITGETTVHRIAPAEPAQLPAGPDAAGEPPA